MPTSSFAIEFQCCKELQLDFCSVYKLTKWRLLVNPVLGDPKHRVIFYLWWSVFNPRGILPFPWYSLYRSPLFLEHFLLLVFMTTLVPHSPDHLALPASLCSSFLSLSSSPLNVLMNLTLRTAKQSLWSVHWILSCCFPFQETTPPASHAHCCLSQKPGNLPWCLPLLPPLPRCNPSANPISSDFRSTSGLHSFLPTSTASSPAQQPSYPIWTFPNYLMTVLLALWHPHKKSNSFNLFQIMSASWIKLSSGFPIHRH